MTNSSKVEFSGSATIKKNLTSIFLALLLIVSSALSPIPAQALTTSSNTDISKDFSKASEYIINLENRTLIASTYRNRRRKKFKVNRIKNRRDFNKRVRLNYRRRNSNKFKINSYKRDKSPWRKRVGRKQNFYRDQHNKDTSVANSNKETEKASDNHRHKNNSHTSETHSPEETQTTSDNHRHQNNSHTSRTHSPEENYRHNNNSFNFIPIPTKEIQTTPLSHRNQNNSDSSFPNSEEETQATPDNSDSSFPTSEEETQTTPDNFDSSVLKSANKYLISLIIIILLVVSVIAFVFLGTLDVGIILIQIQWLFNYIINLNNRYQVTGFINKIYSHPIGGLIIIVSGTCYAIYALAQPDGTQLFQITQTWISNQLAAVSMIIASAFFLLRAMLIIYLSISLVQILQAAMQGEDWRSHARIPLMIIAIITISNILLGLINFVTGSAGEAELMDSDEINDESDD